MNENDPILDDEEHDDGIPEAEKCEPDPLRQLHGKHGWVKGFDRETGEYVELDGTIMSPWALDENITADDFDDDAA